MKAILYRYPHPLDSTRFIYVGQQRGRDRDARHRKGYDGFGKRFKERFPGIELPRPIRAEVEIENHLELNELETIWMFQYHTWCGYPDGMNLSFPGSLDYQKITEMARRARAALSPERQSEIMTRVSRGASFDERSAWSRKIPRHIRKAAKLKAQETLGSEGRSSAARKRSENLGIKRLKEIAAKVVATRRSRGSDRPSAETRKKMSDVQKARQAKIRNVRESRSADTSPSTTTCE